MNLAELFVKLALDASDYAQGLADSAKKTQEWGEKVNGTYRDAAGRMRDAQGRFVGMGKAANDAAGGLNVFGLKIPNLLGGLGSLGSALGGVATVAGGMIAANIFGNLAGGVSNFVSTGLQAVETAQQLEMGLGALLTQNNMYTSSIEEVTTATTKELMTQAEYTQRQAELAASIDYQKASIQEQIERIRQTEAAWGAAGLETIQQKAQLEKMQVALQGTEQDLAGLTRTQTDYATSSKTVYSEAMSMAEAQKLAAAQSKDLLGFVEKLAVVSPFEQEQVAQVTKFAIGAGLASDEAKNFTSGFLDLAAAVGISSDSLSFASDQLLQVAKVGQLTTMDLRQLRRMGIDLEKVIGVEMGMSIDEFNAKAKDTPEIFNELFNSVARFSKNTFGGTVEKMASSLGGIKSTLSDLFTVGARKFLQPLVEAATPAAMNIIGKMTDFVLGGGGMERLGQQAAGMLTQGMAFLGNLPSMDTGSIIEMLGLTPQTTELIDKIVASISSLAQTITGLLFPALSGFSAGGALDMVNQAIEFVNAHFAEFQGAVIGIGAALAGAGIVAAIASLGATLVALANPIGIVIAAAALLGAAWAGNWGGIQEKTAAAWAYMQPILTELWTWLQTSIPAAITTLSTFWTATLYPALTAVWTFISGTLFPMFQTFITGYIDVTAQRAQVLADTWTDYVLPALVIVGDFFTSVFLPLLKSIGNLVNAVINKAVEAMAGLWQNILYPALVKVGNYISSTVMPALTNLGKTTETKVSPILKTLSGSILPAMQKGLEGIKKIIIEVTKFFDSLAASVSNFQLPEVLTPGSPTPFEWALRGIADALGTARAKFIDFDGTVSAANYDKLFKIDRSVDDIKGVIGQARDEVEKLFDMKGIERSKTSLSLKMLKGIFQGNSQAILTATDRVKAFQAAIKNSGVAFETIFAGGNNPMSDGGYNVAKDFINAFDRAMVAAKAALEKAIIAGARQAIGMGNSLNNMAKSAIDMVNADVDSLYKLLQTGASMINWDGQILSNAQAQDLYNKKLEEQIAAQEHIAQLQKSQAQLDFLTKQLDLIEQAKKSGLNLADVFGGLQFGAGAPLSSLVEASNRIIQSLIGQVSTDMASISPTLPGAGTGLGASAQNVNNNTFNQTIYSTTGVANLPGQYQQARAMMGT